MQLSLVARMPLVLGACAAVALLASACGGDDESATSSTGTSSGMGGSNAGGEGGSPLGGGGGAGGAGGAASAPAILEAFFGLDETLPLQINLLCPGSAGEDGMPVIFREPLPDQPIDPSVFEVETANGSATDVLCATLQPATDPTELRTVLLTGEFGSAPDDEPVRVTVVGSLVTQGGTDLMGASIEMVTPLAAGPEVIVAERYELDQLAATCPDGTLQAVQLTWAGGVTAAAGATLGDAARLAVTVQVEEGMGTAPVTPFALADLDPDNYIVACLDDARPAVRVEVAAGEFYDPNDDANPATSVMVTEPPF